MKIVNIVPTISQEADGVADVVRNLCDSMTSSGVNVRLAALDWAPLQTRPDYLLDFEIGIGPRRLGRSPAMRRWLRSEVDAGTVDIVHNHGLWMMPNVYAGDVCRGSGVKLVFSPHGTMSPWAFARNRLVKQAFWRMFQRSAMAQAACFHATAESEFLDIRRSGFTQPVCIIPCGVHVPDNRGRRSGGRRRLLFLARVHPKKGVDNLLRAWQVVGRKFPDWELLVVGPDNEGYTGEMQTLAADLGLARVSFLGGLYGEAKLQAYRDADLYVLPSHSENFGITVAEALAAGTPVIVTRGTPWEGVMTHGAGWWIEVGVEPLVACLEEALAASPERLESMGQVGRVWMKRDFSWAAMSERFLLTYRWLLDGGERPAWVRVD